MDKKIYTTEEIRRIVEPIAREYGVKRITLFGSYARGEATNKSDIDFHLEDTGGLWGYFKLCGFKQDLEDCLGSSVDVLTTGSMDREVLEAVRKNEVLIFEQ